MMLMMMTGHVPGDGLIDHGVSRAYLTKFTTSFCNMSTLFHFGIKMTAACSIIKFITSFCYMHMLFRFGIKMPAACSMHMHLHAIINCYASSFYTTMLGRLRGWLKEEVGMAWEHVLDRSPLQIFSQ